VLVESSILDRASQVINDGLERHAWTDAQLAELSSELSRINLLARLSDGLRGERASLLQFDVSRTDLLTLQELPDTGTVRLQKKALRAAWAIWPAGWVNKDKAAYISTIQRYIDAVKHPAELPSTLAEIEAARASSSVWNKIRNPLFHQAMPALTGSAKRIAVTQTILHSLATACAVERYGMAHGRLPETLGDLVPAFLPSIPTDPLTSEPLCYNQSETGSYLIYGTGWDQTDNAGSGATHINRASTKSVFTKTMNQPDWGVLVKF
jgi:hypothetical protein